MRIGFGYDIHKLIKGRDLILGGVRIDYDYGLLGHSDADVLLHSVCDAILGAIAMGDIGQHFPDNDPAYKGISSIQLLTIVYDLLLNKHYSISNIDSTVVAEKPRLTGYIEQMRSNIARVMHCSLSRVNVKATTKEGLDSIGNGEGIASYAVVLINNHPETGSDAIAQDR